MSSEQFGLTASVSTALGGMRGGGIYAVLGVVAGIAGPATGAAFALAVAVLVVELLYFERETLEREVASVEATVLDDASGVPPNVE